MKHNLAKYKDLFNQWFFFIACTFCLMLPALYNGYPLVNPDTGGYIEHSFDLHVAIDRPIMYSIFIKIASLFGLSLWPVVFFQTLYLVYFLIRIGKKLLGENYNNRISFLIILLLSTCTSASWNSCHLVADCFTPVLLLAIADFYLSPSLNKKQKFLYFFAIWFFMQMHNSHLLIVLLLCFIGRVHYLIQKDKAVYKKTISLFCLTLFSFVSISFFNLWEGNSFRPSASTHVFLMARMAEDGILDKFLKEYCPTEHYTLCNYQGKTGDRQWDFMWSGKGNLQDMGGHPGGWNKAQDEYNLIIRRSLLRPKYLGMHIYESIEGSIRQLSQITVDILVQGEPSAPYTMMYYYFQNELKEYRTSFQQQGRLPQMMGVFNTIIFLFSVFTAALALWLYKKEESVLNKNWCFFIAFIGVSILINAWVTATFSTIVERFQNRVFWLIPYACIIMLINHFSVRKNSST